MGLRFSELGLKHYLATMRGEKPAPKSFLPATGIKIPPMTRKEK